MTTKDLLRAQKLKQRDALTDGKEKSRQICRKLIGSEAFKRAKTVFVYISFRSEVDTSPVIDECFRQGKRVCVPVVRADGLMDAVSIQSFDGLTFNKYGIAEPADKSKTVKGGDIDLCVVPGSVFDLSLNRIGYGKGYYDRFLSGADMVKAAFAFDCQIADNLPAESFDIKMDCVITETRILGEL